jgi:hypothetical protein
LEFTILELNWDLGFGTWDLVFTVSQTYIHALYSMQVYLRALEAYVEQQE